MDKLSIFGEMHGSRNCANRKIITPRRGHLLSKVSDLIDKVMNFWDEDLVTQTLWPIDAQGFS